MRKSFVMATLAVAGAGGVGVGAYTMHGSDTLFNVTQDMVTTTSVAGTPLCPSASAITYVGGGSGSGENAMIAGNQGVSPMSRFLAGSVTRASGGGPGTATGACQGYPTNTFNDGGVYNPAAAQNASGLVIGLDGVGIFSSPSTCSGAQDAGDNTCPAQNTATGLVGSTGTPTTVTLPSSATYTFNNWRDVIRVLWTGKLNNGTVDCNSEVRNFLANNYSKVFAAQTGCSSCTAITHLWRRDDASGTTDVFSQLLGFGGPSATGGGTVSQPSPQGATYHFGSDNFCNTTTIVAQGPSGSATPWNGTVPGENAGAENTTSGIMPNDSQDHDPIRKPCVGTGSSTLAAAEDVCERSTPAPTAAIATATISGGAITGVTISNQGAGYLSSPNVNIIGGGGSGCTATATINAPCIPTSHGACQSGTGNVTAVNLSANPCGSGFTSAPTIDLTFYGSNLASTSESTLGLLLPMVDDNVLGSSQFPVGACNGPSILVHAPLVTKSSGLGNTGGMCPSGDNSGTGAECSVPADSTGNPNCLANAGQAPAFTFNQTQGSGGTGPNPAAVDGRAFNLWIWHQGSDGTWSVASDNSNRPVYGAFNRIQSKHSVSSATCSKTDMTDQIGCMVLAEPCSFGYSGREGAKLNPPAALNWVNGEPPTALCVQSDFTYPLGRKLYLNSIAGFGQTNTSVSPNPAADLALAQCENDAGTVNLAINAEGFIPLGTGSNGGNPFCEDFNEGAFCNDGGTNSNACAATQAAGLGVGLTTTCGNGTKEPLEECDFAATLGTSNNPCTTSCSSICRCN